MFVFQVAGNSYQVSGNTINNVDYQPNICSLETNSWHILLDNFSYRIQLLEWDSAEKTIQFQINGKSILYKYLDEQDILLQKLGLNKLDTQKNSIIKAPMPGLIRKILVNPGDTVQKGDSLLVLEAMKMENVLKASANGTVQTIEVTAMQVVEKNQILIKFQ
ncbi:MAG: acetyl-CoA carboxylase biotin carboxyl carrier protein subunit [Bacteroidia bacterium]|nr:acetyl-CoA carboxylase biotin carboxyl carrier protein subunit [Bacteroidia bacterium]